MGTPPTSPTGPGSAPPLRVLDAVGLVMDTPDVPDQPQPDQPQPGPAQTGRANELTITVTCSAHGARGFCNLRITKVGGEITLDPHVAGGCVLVLDETAATAVFDAFGQWLA